MKNLSVKSSGKWLALGLGLVVLDQITKLLVLKGWRFEGALFDIVFVQNTGAGFGILQGMNLALIFVYIAVFALLVWSWPRIRQGKVFYLLIIAGLVGNLVDRIRLGYVVDWFNLGWFPVFNVADSCISIGIIGYVVTELLFERKKKKSGS
ncbi:MAG: signal peptidase II [Candidatus Woesearchaeota archaeon]